MKNVFKFCKTDKNITVSTCANLRILEKYLMVNRSTQKLHEGFMKTYVKLCGPRAMHGGLGLGVGQGLLID